MMRDRRTRAELVDALFDHATRHDGFTASEARQALGISQRQFEQAVQDIRRIFSSDKETLVADRQGWGEPWTYRLVDSYEQAEGWASDQLRHVETRISTLIHVLATIVNATDGRTRDGKKAREFHHTLKYLVERLEIVDDSFLPSRAEQPTKTD